MARVFIPPLLKSLTGGVSEVELEGESIRTLLDGLEEQFPGVRERLCEGEELKPGLSVAVDGDINPRGIRARVAPDSEVHFLPSIGGG